MTATNFHALEALAARLAEAALTIMVRTCRQELADAKPDDLQAACAGIKIKVPEVIHRLIDDVREAPWIAEQAFTAAAFDLASAGIEVLRGAKE